MRTICDVCESAAAVLFCAADEAALCLPCDHKVHMCNKLASKHVRVGLDNPVDVPRCDICENSPAFFYCEVDGSSLCLQCDSTVHVEGKRTHRRYLMLRQRVQFPGDKPGLSGDPATQFMDSGTKTNEHSAPPNLVAEGAAKLDANANADGPTKMESGMIDLNIKPLRFHGQASNKQPRG